MKTPLEVLKLYAGHDYTLLGAFASRMQGVVVLGVELEKFEWGFHWNDTK